MIPDDTEEPPVVTRRDQWGLKPLPKRRGRKPATPKPKDEPKPKREPRGGGSRKARHFITIDDIVPPTPAPPRAAAASSQAEPVEGPEAEPVEGPEDSHLEAKKEDSKMKKEQGKVKKNSGQKDQAKEKAKKQKVQKDTKEEKEKAAKSKSKASKRKSSDDAQGAGDDARRAEEDEKNKIVWTPVSKTAAPLVAGNLKWGPVQDHLVAASRQAEPSAEPDPHAAGALVESEEPAGAAEPAEPDGKKAKVGENEDKLKTFARRWCPKTSPARDRWLVVRDVFNMKIKPVVEGLGFSAYQVEDRTVFCHLHLSLPAKYVSLLHLQQISILLWVTQLNKTANGPCHLAPHSIPSFHSGRLVELVR